MHYSENETMESLGEMTPIPIMNSQVRKQIRDVIEAYGYNYSNGREEFTQFAIDMYMLGYIHGGRKVEKEYV